MHSEYSTSFVSMGTGMSRECTVLGIAIPAIGESMIQTCQTILSSNSMLFDFPFPLIREDQLHTNFFVSRVVYWISSPSLLSETVYFYFFYSSKKLP